MLPLHDIQAWRNRRRDGLNWRLNRRRADPSATERARTSEAHASPLQRRTGRVSDPTRPGVYVVGVGSPMDVLACTTPHEAASKITAAEPRSFGRPPDDVPRDDQVPPASRLLAKPRRATRLRPASS